MNRIVNLGSPLPTAFDLSIVIGPWCIPAHQEKFLDMFFMPEEIFADPELLETAVKQARELTSRLAPRLAQELNRKLGSKQDEAYWDTVLAPWLVRFSAVLVDRLHRIADFRKTYGLFSHSVPLLPEQSTFAFADTRDFIEHGILDPVWNHWLFSILIRKNPSSHWHYPALPEVHRDAGKPEASLLMNGEEYARRFPPISGFDSGSAMRLSEALQRNHRTQDDTIPLRLLGCPDADPLPLDFTEDEAFALAIRTLPWSFQKLCPPLPVPKQAGIRVISAANFENDAYRFQVAAWRAAGDRLVVVQKDGECGYVRSSAEYPLLAYSQHRFISWGWKKHSGMPGNITPLPHPALDALRKSHRETEATLLFAGTDMSLLPHALTSMLRGRQQYAYREDKAKFTAALPSALRKKMVYCPHDSSPISLSDAEWMRERFADLAVWEGDFLSKMLSCRLLVLDHAGTALAQAFAADVPTILFWNRDAVQFASEALPLLRGLRRAGILVDSPLDAAEQVRAVWDNLDQWWQSTREARDEWCEQYASIADQSVIDLWESTLEKL